MIETVCQMNSLGEEQERLAQELRIIAENLANLIQKNASVALDQTEQAEFREELWGGVVDHIRIDEKSKTVVFRGGIEITI